ncbi:hypothetical protein HME9302_01616 [Alteripontixanthobacter maritimus]|uniref:17 kDa surface antigen n=1 Tax=Alteripontixanthobacter maritimus TaxID=2161824 RepID=A0A369QBW6_9SPHN|nr:glycine zipper 2TM domain-containing protein [Alteripontixanthobacter maritimus]RDC60409.1 hypothetical protein HME9302_01616 [Alteripontixanthobacter maritimus]
MQKNTLKFAAIAIAAPGLAFAMPAVAAVAPASAPAVTAPMTQTAPAYQSAVFMDVTNDHHRRWHKKGRGHKDRYYDDRRSYRGDRYQDNRYYGDPIRNNTRIWQGRDGRYYCKKDNGTTGLLIGGAVGALAGRELAGRGDRTLGTILGAAGGAILGRAIDKSNSRCR